MHGCTKTLTEPDSKHIKFQQMLIDVLIVINIHKDVVEEGSDPRADSSNQVTPGQKICEQTVTAPRKIWNCQKEVDDCKTCKQKKLRLVVSNVIERNSIDLSEPGCAPCKIH